MNPKPAELPVSTPEFLWKVTWEIQARYDRGWRDDGNKFSEFCWAANEYDADRKIMRKIENMESPNYRAVNVKVEKQEKTI